MTGKSKTLPSWRIVRRLVQCAVFLIFLIPLIASDWMIAGLTEGGDERLPTPSELPFFGSLSSSQITEIVFVDPYAALQMFAASKTVSFDILAFIAPVLVIYVLLRARMFCGWVCPVNLLLEGLDWLRKKLKFSVQERVLSHRAKMLIGAGILLLSFALAVPLFEVFSPISFINKGLILGSTAGFITFICIVVMELFWGHRVWCRSLCPLGGLYQSLGRLGFLSVRIQHDSCTQCKLCKDECLCDPLILDPALSSESAFISSGDCMMCGKCIDICPTKALSASLTPPWMR